MKNQLHHAVVRIAIPILLATLACSSAPTLPAISTSNGPGYRFDNFAPKINESSAFQEYQAIAK